VALQDVSGNQMKPDVGMTNTSPPIDQTALGCQVTFISIYVQHFLSATDP